MYDRKKVKQQKCRTPRKIQNGKFLIKWQNQNLKHIERMQNNCHNRKWWMKPGFKAG